MYGQNDKQRKHILNCIVSLEWEGIEWDGMGLMWCDVWCNVMWCDECFRIPDVIHIVTNKHIPSTIDSLGN